MMTFQDIDAIKKEIKLVQQKRCSVYELKEKIIVSRNIYLPLSMYI